MSWLYGYRLCSLILALALGIGVVALGVETLVSWAYVLIDSDQDVYVLHARVGIAAGLVTATSVILQLILDSCHRPTPIIFDLVWSVILSAFWAAVAILSISGTRLACVVDDPDASDICSLLLIACMYARNGTPVWMCPVIKGFRTVVVDARVQGSNATTTV
ncbi:hypothetical protein FKP32DRAFT_1226754 [Trametes sanguinea]|nr:hypothetical protein FKP32DRAFT_1226754 [Trametes sanguinea]